MVAQRSTRNQLRKTSRMPVSWLISDLTCPSAAIFCRVIAMSAISGIANSPRASGTTGSPSQR